MTGKELQTTLLAMGCPSSVADEDLYLYLVNASLHKIYNDVEITAKGSIYAHGILPKARIKERHHPSRADISIPIVGKAYSLRVCGDKANLLIGTGDTTSSVVLTELPTVLKGFAVDGMAIISLVGQYAYSVFDVCTYDDLLSLDVEDIPDGGDYTDYDVTRRYEDFSTFISYPTDRDGAIIEGAEASGNILRLAADYKGEVFFTYRRIPIKTIALDAVSRIDIPQKYEMLLPILFMAYYYIDVDESKAECYMESYKDMLKTLQKPESYKYISPEEEPIVENPPMTAEYNITDGWA